MCVTKCTNGQRRVVFSEFKAGLIQEWVRPVGCHCRARLSSTRQGRQIRTLGTWSSYVLMEYRPPLQGLQGHFKLHTSFVHKASCVRQIEVCHPRHFPHEMNASTKLQDPRRIVFHAQRRPMHMLLSALPSKSGWPTYLLPFQHFSTRAFHRHRPLDLGGSQYFLRHRPVFLPRSRDC